MALSGKWSDLRARVLSALALAALALVAALVGGWVFHLLVAGVSGAMLWELMRLFAPNDARAAMLTGVLGAATLFVAIIVPLILAVPLLLAPIAVGFAQLERGKLRFLGYALAVMMAGMALMQLRDEAGLLWLLWVLLVVVASDVAGYFAGKALGGPKFWPRISPKKTWSGTVAGWIAAGIVGALFSFWISGPVPLVAVSVALAMAAQMGDIAESALKRGVGVKDASNLLPGHGGFLDRMDGMVGASLLLLVVMVTSSGQLGG